MRCSVFRASAWTCWDGCVCACVVEVGVDHLVSHDLRERRVACACVFARGRICVDVGARVPAWTRTIVCLCSSAPIGRACVLVMLALELARSRLVYHLPTLPHPPMSPSVHPSVSPGSVHPFLYDLSFSLFRRREPKANLALAGQPVPRARQTEAPRDSYTCRQTRLGLGRKGRSSPSWSPPSFKRAVSVAPAWSPESFL